MTTPQTVRVLNAIMTENHWTQQDLANTTGLLRSTIGHHLIEGRPVRDEHLVAYLAVVPQLDRPRLFAAWIHDLLVDRPEIFHELSDASSRIQNGVKQWSPELTSEQRQSLEFWDHKLRTDAEAARYFDMFTRREQGR